eukprot:2626159-Rhodomonas_salina.2
MNVLPTDRGLREEEGCNHDKPVIGDESMLPTGCLQLEATIAYRMSPSLGYDMAEIDSPHLVSLRQPQLSRSLAQGHRQPAPIAASVRRAHPVKEGAVPRAPGLPARRPTSGLKGRLHGQVGQVVVHSDAHGREHPPGGAYQSQELHVLVPVKGGVGAVLGAHSVGQGLVLESAPLLTHRS